MNFRYALPPFEAPSIVGISSEMTEFPASNVLADLHPAYPWRTFTSTADGTVEFDFGGATPVNGVFVNRTNYAQILLKKRNTVGGTFEPCSPNLLLWSEQLALTSGAPGNGLSPTGWQDNGASAAAVTVDYIAGPYRRQKAQLLTMSSVGGGVKQLITYGISVGGRAMAGHVWLRTTTSVGTCTIRLSGPSTLTTTATLSPVWQRIPIGGTFAAGSNTAFTVEIRREASDLSAIVFGGAQISPNALTPLAYDYRTEGFGVVLLLDPRVERRKSLLVPSGFQDRYLQLCIPAGQPTDDGGDYYSTGAVTLTQRLTVLPGRMQWPISVTTPQSVLATEFLSGGKEFSQISVDKKAILEFAGVFVAEDTEAILQSFYALSPGKPFLFCESVRPGGAPVEAKDPTLCYLARRTSETKLTYTMPEVLDFSLAIEEVI